MSVDILQQVIGDICRSESGFSIQLDESTDVINCAQLLIFVRKKSSMLGRKSDFRVRVMEVAPHVKFLHCMIHRFALSCKVLPAEFFDVLSLVIKMVNNVKGSALNNRLFKILCEDLDADHCVLLFHSNVR